MTSGVAVANRCAIRPFLAPHNLRRIEHPLTAGIGNKVCERHELMTYPVIVMLRFVSLPSLCASAESALFKMETRRTTVKNHLLPIHRIRGFYWITHDSFRRGLGVLGGASSGSGQSAHIGPIDAPTGL